MIAGPRGLWHKGARRVGSTGPECVMLVLGRPLGLLVAIALGLASLYPVSASADERFSAWLADLRREALTRGISAATLDKALGGITPIRRVIELDRHQPEFTQTFWTYLDKRVSAERITCGRDLLVQHRTLLERVAAKYGVQPRFLVAFWGLESNFGDYTGAFPVVAALATLAYDERRSAFFRAQLLDLLAVIDDGDIAAEAKASWAGAMGQTQFMPSTYKAYAVDFDGDGRRDLWNSLADIFGSSARYLAAAGWQSDRTWGREVSLPPGFDLELTGLNTRKGLAEWQRLGVRRADGRDLPRVDIDGSVILPGGHAGGPALMVYQNFRTTMVWNRSILYAVAVGHLADRLVGGGAFQTPRPEKEQPLFRVDVAEIQRRLARLGYDPGGADGVAGPMTRRAIKQFQRGARLPADGYPSVGLLERLRGATVQ